MAGPAVNLVIALGVYALLVLTSPSPAPDGILRTLLTANLLLAAFNLLPFPPLDGSGALPLFLNDSLTRRYQEFIWGNPAIGWIGLIVAWQIFGKLFDPIFMGAVNLLYPGVNYR